MINIYKQIQNILDPLLPFAQTLSNTISDISPAVVVAVVMTGRPL